MSGDFIPETVYKSSGTTSKAASKHLIAENQLYIQNAINGFQSFYGDISEYCILGLLPSYLERKGSSLVTMVHEFIRKSKYKESGTFLYDHKKLFERLETCKSNNIQTVLIGVSFALVDFIETYKIDFPNLIVMETGGMKGRKKELTRGSLHDKLKNGFGVEKIHSEYGMTELLSQAYSDGYGIYKPSPTMRIVVTELNDPLTVAPYGKAGVINIIDLANIDSCAFLSTEDLGIAYKDGSFEVLGRQDHSDIRGCSLMVSDIT